MDERALLYVGNDGDLRLVPPSGHTYKEIKEAVGASWDDEVDAWKFPRVRSNVLQVREFFGDAVSMSEDVLRMGDGHGFPLKKSRAHVPDGLELLPFQKDAVQYLLSNPHGTLLNVSPGLGKTVISIVAAQAFSVSAGAPVLIIAPASLQLNWWREIEKWAPDATIEGAHGQEPLFGAQFTVTTYDTVVQHPEWFDRDRWHKWGLLLVDESVLIKNRNALRYIAIAGGSKKEQKNGKTVIRKWKGLIHSVDHVWLLSGSPTTRYADDLWSQMALLYPKAFKSFWRFANRFCVFVPNIWSKTGKEIAGTLEARDITWELGDLMLTINQEDVLPDLPEYLFDTVDVELTPRQKKAYREMLNGFLIELDGGPMTADNKLAQLIRLQQITSGMANFDGGGNASAKADALIELLDAQAFPTPMIVWAHWRGSAQDLTSRLTAQHVNAQWVSGESLTRTRDRTIEAYKRGETDVLVLSIGVGKFGHTLTNTRTVVYLDKTWAADDYIQSLRRVRRIGLTWRPYLVTLRAPGTVDDLLELNLAGKMPSIAKVTNSQLKELLKGLGL